MHGDVFDPEMVWQLGNPGGVHPLVPKGDEEIRFQISADHTPADIDMAIDMLGRFVSS